MLETIPGSACRPIWISWDSLTSASSFFPVAGLTAQAAPRTSPVAHTSRMVDRINELRFEDSARAQRLCYAIPAVWRSGGSEEVPVRVARLADRRYRLAGRERRARGAAVHRQSERKGNRQRLRPQDRRLGARGGVG